jgi:hypothetical protein
LQLAKETGRTGAYTTSCGKSPCREGPGLVSYYQKLDIHIELFIVFIMQELESKISPEQLRGESDAQLEHWLNITHAVRIMFSYYDCVNYSIAQEQYTADYAERANCEAGS